MLLLQLSLYACVFLYVFFSPECPLLGISYQLRPSSSPLGHDDEQQCRRCYRKHIFGSQAQQIVFISIKPPAMNGVVAKEAMRKLQNEADAID